MKLIATNISNLTDARFFASYMPDLLLMPYQRGNDLDNLLEWFRQVKPWIEGPQWGLAITGNLSGEEREKILELGIKTLLYEGEPMNLESIEEFDMLVKCSSATRIEQMEKMNKISGIVTDYNSAQKISEIVKTDLFVQIESVEDWRKIQVLDFQISGVVLRGDEEEKVGIRSFEQLSDILEELIDLR
ncbi:MAG: hypothetical protein KDC80_06615 [Saprospiraceae bacterium]|nr:hypothetical protein [Saprospiraceae bacterium]